MKVTSIQAQVKTAGRFSIFVDDAYAFSLSDSALLEQKIRVGQQLSAEQVKQLKQVSADDKLYEQVLRYVALRIRSTWEIHTYLERKGASPVLAASILNKLSDNGIIDDLVFARAWVRHRRLLRPSSKRKLQQELRAKHVSDEVIEQALTDDAVDDAQTLQAVALKKRSRYKDDIKLMQYLVRQGFRYEDVKRVVGELGERQA